MLILLQFVPYFPDVMDSPMISPYLNRLPHLQFISVILQVYKLP